MRTLDAPSGAHTSVSYNGTVTVRKVWGGAASVEEVEADGPTHLELLNVRLYNEQSHQWSLNGASSSDASLSEPMFGEFFDGRGTFYDQELSNGRTVLVRQTFFDITPSSYAFEQAVSDDDGRTWHPNFTAKLTRVSATAPSEGPRSTTATSHDFDFNYATWSTHITTIDRSPKGGTSRATLTGTVAVRKIWNGRAFMEEFKAGNAGGSIEGLTLFLYDPQTHEWSQTFAGKGDGTFERSMIGTFKDGRGELAAFPSPHDGKMELVREVWSNIKPTTHHFEIQYSDDGGATWHANFIAELTRIGPGL